MFDDAPLRSPAPQSRVAAAAGPLREGIVAGTRIATGTGYVDVAALRPGMRVLTLDHGLQPVRAIEHGLAGDCLDVPPDALGNARTVSLLADQGVLVEGAGAQGDSFALVPAQALDGIAGICPAPDGVERLAFRVHFAADEVVFTDFGALMLCPRVGDVSAEGYHAASGRSMAMLDPVAASAHLAVIERLAA